MGNPKTDNSHVELKSHLRRRLLPKDARVLDLFCGRGEMYHGTYKGRVKEYRGVDKEKVHDTSLCTIDDNMAWVKTHDIERFNVFDLDDYGSPWDLIYLVMSKAKQKEIAMFVTDGLVLRAKMMTSPTKFVSATNLIPIHMKIPGLHRWYVDMFKTMLLDIESRYGYKAEDGLYTRNSKGSVFYWGIRFNKLTNA